MSSVRSVTHVPGCTVITDDWPEHIHVSDAEIDVFEVQFGDLLDDLFNLGK